MNVKPLCHVILSGYDFERIGAALRYYPAFKVYVIENEDPWPDHRDIKKDVHDKLFDFIKKAGPYREGENLFSYGVNFYDIREAIVQLYELFRREQKDGYNVIVNICSGTKPVVIAATWAATLAKCGIVYFFAKGYERSPTGEIIAKGVIQLPIYFEPLFEMTEALLRFTSEEREIISQLHKRQAKTITEIAGGKNASRKKIAKYAYYLKNLERRKIVEITRNKISLTALGELIAKLLEIDIKFKS
jgi:hypothetical protein